MAALKIAIAQWPDGLLPNGDTWVRIIDRLESNRPDVLITNEMPFGPWLPESACYDPNAAKLSVDLHREGLEALRDLKLPLVISSRPVPGRSHLANEAFCLFEGNYRFLHQKHYFPDEHGFYEANWFQVEKTGFEPLHVNGISIGVLLCTEAMFNEHARHYGRKGVNLLAIPRAAGIAYRHWEIACGMAAVVSGAFVASANRTGKTASGQVFGGKGMLFHPSGDQVIPGSIANDDLLVFTDIALEESASAKKGYPCYVPEYRN